VPTEDVISTHIGISFGTIWNGKLSKLSVIPFTVSLWQNEKKLPSLSIFHVLAGDVLVQFDDFSKSATTFTFACFLISLRHCFDHKPLTRTLAVLDLPKLIRFLARAVY
jgi:hypothetical protein